MTAVYAENKINSRPELMRKSRRPDIRSSAFCGSLKKSINRNRIYSKTALSSSFSADVQNSVMKVFLVDILHTVLLIDFIIQQ